jgi:hypothetical protein
MMLDVRICGNGAECENICPVMRAGRICPPVTQLLEELTELSHPWLAPTASLVH